MLLVDRGNEPGCGHVCAEVDDAESGRLPHDNHQVLADVVQVSLDRADHGRVLGRDRSEEHTSELQSLRHLVCRLLLEKKQWPVEGPVIRNPLQLWMAASEEVSWT